MDNERTANTEALKNIESLSNYLHEEIVKAMNMGDLNIKTKDHLSNARMQAKELRKTLGRTYVTELTGKELDIDMRDNNSFTNTPKI
jgi:hypothetical protein